LSSLVRTCIRGLHTEWKKINKGKLYIARRKNAEHSQKWCKTEFRVEVKGNNEEFDCECGLFDHMGVLCGHALKVLVMMCSYSKKSSAYKL
jgi:hypothetical protein